jgi:Flp pilus assembly protein TadD
LKKQQWILVGSGVSLLCLIYFFGNTIPPKKSPTGNDAPVAAKAIDFNSILAASKQQLSASQQAHIAQLETGVVRGDVKEQQIKVYKQLAAFWQDSALLLLPYGYYTAQAAKLENSQKSLTFAAQFFLEGVRRQDNASLQRWMALEAKELFEKALQLAPNNDSLKVGLGSCYLLGNISQNPMEGITMVREVAERDPENMYAQFMLGLGGMISGQYAKAAERMLKVVQHEPSNIEAVLILAEAYERAGDKAKAAQWYTNSKKHINNPEIVKEIDARIKQLNEK